MGIRKVSKAAGEALDPRALVLATKEYLGLGKNIKDLTTRQGQIKKQLSEAVEEYGEEDDRGHVWLRLPELVGEVHSLQRQRRVGQSFDEDKAVEILHAAGLLESCSKTVRLIDDEAVMAAHYDGKLTEAQIDSMYPKKITYAFVTAKD